MIKEKIIQFSTIIELFCRFVITIVVTYQLYKVNSSPITLVVTTIIFAIWMILPSLGKYKDE